MNTLRPNDFFLGEDAPASVVNANGLLAINVPNDNLALINSVLSIPEDWEGEAIRVRILLVSEGSPTDVSLNLRVDNWGNSTGPVGGVVNVVTTDIESTNPMIVRSDAALVEVPSGFMPGDTLVLLVYPDLAGTTTSYAPKIVGVEYEHD